LVGEAQVTEGIEWRLLYGSRRTLFCRGLAVGDVYAVPAAGADVFRMRYWNLGRLQGGHERLVIGQRRAEAALVELAQRALATEEDGA
jgi:hypothetical protein